MLIKIWLCFFVIIKLALSQELLVFENNNNNNNRVVTDTKIIGAEESKDRYNYMASLQVYVDERNFLGFKTGKKRWAHNCGGSVIKTRYVVTAAHCVNKIPPQLMSVVLGTNDISNQNNGKRYNLKNYTMHEDYVELEKNDIALLELIDEIEYSEDVQPIVLSDEHVGGDVPVLLTGWGFTNPPRFGDTPSKLREAKLKTMTNEKCNEAGMPAGRTEICTYERPLKGACGGDSGGPLVIEGNRTLVGIVSYGTALCAIGYPDVFTRASEFYDWIEENTSE